MKTKPVNDALMLLSVLQMLKRVCIRTDGSRRGERQHETDVTDSNSSTGGGDEAAETERGQLESVERMTEEKRQDVVVRLRSACEMALTLVYSDQSTQLREINADAKVDLSL